MADARLKIAVIGSGAAGLTAAWLLRRKHDVTLLEKDVRLGGHTSTVVLESGPDAGTPVDTGFIVFNDRNYPVLLKVFAQLGCAARNSDMSFGFHSKVTGLSYCASDIGGLLAQPTNLFRPSYWKMWRDVFRFWREARERLLAGRLAGKTMGQFLGEIGIGRDAIDKFILPMGAAIWSAPQNGMLDFPAESLMRFWENHGLLSANDHPQWKTVVGGSHSYAKIMLKEIAEVVTGVQIESVVREESGVVIRMRDGSARLFDRVVIGAHADQALRLLGDPSAEEKRLLGAWKYAANQTVLHTDESLMPANRRAWASWNYVEEAAGLADGAVPVTYWMNRLQGLKTSRGYFVTLNPSRPIANEHVIREFDYEHPQYTFAAVESQRELPTLNGKRNTFFCGSYFGYGFHEDAMKSGVAVAKEFGIEL